MEQKYTSAVIAYCNLFINLNIHGVSIETQRNSPSDCICHQLEYVWSGNRVEGGAELRATFARSCGRERTQTKFLQAL